MFTDGTYYICAFCLCVAIRLNLLWLPKAFSDLCAFAKHPSAEMADLVQPKKPAGGAFGIFMSEKRPEFIKLCAGKPATQISKMGGEKWKVLPEAEKSKYQKKYEEVKAEYEEKMKAFLDAGGEKAARKVKEAKDGKRKKAKDPDAPKKPAGGAYGIYLAEHRPSIVASLPKGHKITDVAKAAGAKWKALSEEEKKPYEAKFQKKMAEYKEAMEEYNTKGAEAEDDEEEEEEEEIPKKKARGGA